MNETWKSRLEEILHIIADPFLRDFLKTGTDEKNMPLIQHTDKIVEQLFKEAIIVSMEESIFRPTIPSEELKRRQEVQLEGNARKYQKNGLSMKKEVRPSQVKSLKTQDLIDQEELKIFLDKPLDELEVITAPSQYPTNPQTVSPLAELYYLTQTLPLIKLLPGCHKVLMTDNFELALAEGKIAVLYSRIEELKRQGKWSLRQPQKFYDP